MHEPDLLTRVFDALEAYYGLGNEVRQERSARFVRNVSAPRIYDANHVSCVRVETPDEIDAVLARADELFAGSDHRAFHVDPWTPPGFTARLLLDDYEAEEELHLLLVGDLQVSRELPAVEIRLAESDEDWEVLERLTRLDHEEEARRDGRPVWDDAVTSQMVATKRAKTPALRFWLARADGIDCAFFSSWPGSSGIGKVEDLFTHPDARGRGIATALLAHCVRDTRERGAGPVVIGALPSDTPKHMYAAMGFHPLCVTRSYRRLLTT